ncbi:C-C motif chemokine 3-like 1 isoform X2 [Labrus mixtus]|uniref:C-C motif chemokine 3-like 1 isoform X2 n=1 Tax=Labrus mixtus TaxID=508554 RepID=UPI0029C02B5D|nr:C-C motif chemokine 3-like 1 isoform X2 [Labrus mixtus]
MAMEPGYDKLGARPPFSLLCRDFERGPSKQHCPRPCCKAYSEAVVSTDVIGDTYHEVPAHALCFKALIFKTPNGRVCVDPHEEWAQKLTAKMKKLRRLQI